VYGDHDEKINYGLHPWRFEMGHILI
jgi:hypothetical protein